MADTPDHPPPPADDTAEGAAASEPAPRTAPDDDTAAETVPETAEPDPAARIAELETLVAALDDKWRRAAAEMENVRRRADIQIEQGRKYAVADFAKAILPVADNLARGLGSVPEETMADEAVKSLIDGIGMTAKELGRVLETFGVVEVPADGVRFDPKVHDALFEVPLPDMPSGMVVQVIEAGYTIQDRLLRPAKVGVSKGGPKPETEATPAVEADSPPPPGGRQTAYDKARDAAGRPDSGAQVDEEL